MVFHWNLRDNKSPQISWTLLSILADLNNDVMLIVSSCSLISKSSSPFTNPLVTVPRAPITIGINVTFMFHSFFQFQARSEYLCFFSLSFSFNLWEAAPAKSTILQVIFFCWLLSLSEIRWSVSFSKSQRSLCITFHWRDSWLCVYYLFLWSNFNLFHNSRWNTFPIQL